MKKAITVSTLIILFYASLGVIGHYTSWQVSAALFAAFMFRTWAIDALKRD